MKNIFPLAGILLVINGVLHLIKTFVNGFTPLIPALMLLLFGVAYLIIGGALLRRRDSSLRWAVIVPLIGILLTVFAGDLSDTLSVFFVVLNVLVVGLCAYVLFAGRGALGRVR